MSLNHFCSVLAARSISKKLCKNKKQKTGQKDDPTCGLSVLADAPSLFKYSGTKFAKRDVEELHENALAMRSLARQVPFHKRQKSQKS